MEVNINKSHFTVSLTIRPHNNPPLFLLNNPFFIKDRVSYLVLHSVREQIKLENPYYEIENTNQT